MLELPSYSQFSREQTKVHNLPITGRHLVSGPPGTGKTVLAIYRAEMLLKAGKRTQFMVYGKPLKQYMLAAMEKTGVAASAETFYTWFWGWYRTNLGRRQPPRVPGGGDYDYDWGEILEQVLGRAGRYAQYDHLIIDEAQDFPPQMFQVMRQISKNITVFADENQRVREQKSSLKEIQRWLGVQDVAWLQKNYRNSRPIAELAREFYCGTASGMPDLPDRNGELPEVRLGTPQQQADFVAQFERNNPDLAIAVFVPTYKLQKTWRNRLGHRGTKNPVELYSTYEKDSAPIDFGQKGIKIISYESAKGLEFDAVFIPELDTRLTSPDSIDERMRFYVMTSRARSRLVLMADSAVAPPILKRVPDKLYRMSRLGTAAGRTA